VNSIKIKGKGMSIEKIIFYNYYNLGDLHVSRSLVRYIVENIPVKEYNYYHRYTPKILQDIPKLKHIGYNFSDDYRYKGWFFINDRLYCNTWYNAFYEQEFKGCTIQTLFNIFKRGLKETIDFDLLGEPIDYLPSIDFNYFNLSSITSWLSCDQREKVLISNCDVLSGQSENFDLNPIINYISDVFPGVVFLITNIMGEKINKQNVYYVQDIIKVDDIDLNEISFLSKFCDIIIGRNSGPHTFCMTKENFHDSLKTFMCFSHENFGMYDLSNAKMVCSSEYSMGRVSSVIEQEIRRKYLL
jgi:hypothetical protein